MKTNLSDIVSKYLFTYGSVCIPGIGTFSISDSSSGFKLENDVLTPPTKMVDFSEEMSNEDGLVKYLKSNHDFSRKEAEKKISDYSKKFLNDLLNYGVAVIPGIGKLSKYASGEIVFDPSKEYLITNNYMLPELKLTPIDNTGVVVNEIIPQKAPVAATAVAAAVPTAATTAAFLGDTPAAAKTQDPIVTKSTKPAPITPEIVKPEPKVELKKEVKPIPKQTPKSTPIIKKESIVSVPKKEVPPPIVYDDEPSFLSVWLWPLLSIIALCFLLFFGIKSCNKYMAGEGFDMPNPLDKITNSDKTVIDKSALNLDDYLKENPKLQKYAKFLTKEIVDAGCIIIVGTYKKSRNAIRMKDKLMRAGLDPYTESHQGLTRVGVLFPCEDHDLIDYIGTVRKSFDKDAWYLSPKMDVAK